ncbi:zinc ribbon domain-containing protein [Pseudomonas solani]|uniref:zinc ribbon domain-containing protein n=1 Tax=Pseudomonas TaxID=286 RepID=UPI0021E0CD69|nr:zinc ribbon domain-containing protein [Pseudomonas sp. PDM13]MCU9949143.1 zinc-ribbon domain-containing protein [Pseudomonas sp. PDM13]
MALIDCPECNRSISDQAPSCPQCGYPMKGGANPRLLSEKNIGQVAGVAGVWLAAPWLARTLVAVTLIIAGTLAYIYR